MARTLGINLNYQLSLKEPISSLQLRPVQIQEATHRYFQILRLTILSYFCKLEIFIMVDTTILVKPILNLRTMRSLLRTRRRKTCINKRHSLIFLMIMILGPIMLTVLRIVRTKQMGHIRI